MPCRLVSAAVMLSVALSLGSAAAARPGVETPAPAQSPAARPCPLPDSSARIAHAAMPQLPAETIRYGVGGSVAVDVKLDEKGRVDGARATSFSSGFLVRSALAAARESTFEPAVRDCVPVASTYVFHAAYDLPDFPPPLHVDPLVYLPGAWRCTNLGGRLNTVLFVRSGNGLDETDGTTVTSIAPDEYRMWRIRQNGNVVGWAYPWVGETWDWTPHATTVPYAQLRRIDASTLLITTPVGKSVPAGEQGRRCVRVAAAP